VQRPTLSDRQDGDMLRQPGVLQIQEPGVLNTQALVAAGGLAHRRLTLSRYHQWSTTVQQAMNAGLLDELQLHLAPVLLGAGVRLFDRVDPGKARLEIARVVESLAPRTLVPRRPVALVGGQLNWSESIRGHIRRTKLGGATGNRKGQS
jgi:hypothetical protein